MHATTSIRVRALIEAAGATVRFPPYSPDFNPKLQAMLRKAAERTVDDYRPFELHRSQPAGPEAALVLSLTSFTLTGSIHTSKRFVIYLMA